MTPEAAAALVQGIGRRVASAGVPGCALAIWHEGRAVSAAFGLARLTPRTPVSADTVFHLFSGTKLYTAAAVVQLAGAGQVDLDAPVTRYLPEAPLRHPVTLRQLASHASGLPDTLRAFLAVHLAGEQAPDADEALGRYDLRHGRPPGTTVAYRNVNYALLGAVIARVSGMPYAAYVTEHLLRPLGSEATFAYTPAQLLSAATGYIPRFSPARLLLPWLLPAVGRRIEEGRDGRLVRLRPFGLDTAAIGGLLGRATDFLPLAVECLTGERGVLAADARRELLTVHARGAAGIASTVGVGLGWKYGEADGRPFWNHEGGGAGFTSETRIYPGERLAVVLLMNATQTRALSLLAHAVCEKLRVQVAG